MKTSSPSVSSPKSLRSLAGFTLALLPLLVAGCAGTFHEVNVLAPGAVPAQHPTVLVLEPVEVTDATLSASDQQVYRLRFQDGVQAWFSKTNVFQSVVLASTNVIPNSLTLSGTLTEVNKGSEAARLLVGMGAGQERIRGEFTLKDATGQSLIRFNERKSYLGGLGIGGADFLSLDELTFRYGEEVAGNIAKWMHGQKLE